MRQFLFIPIWFLGFYVNAQDTTFTITSAACSFEFATPSKYWQKEAVLGEFNFDGLKVKNAKRLRVDLDMYYKQEIQMTNEWWLEHLTPICAGDTKYYFEGVKIEPSPEAENEVRAALVFQKRSKK